MRVHAYQTVHAKMRPHKSESFLPRIIILASCSANHADHNATCLLCFTSGAKVSHAFCILSQNALKLQSLSSDCACSATLSNLPTRLCGATTSQTHMDRVNLAQHEKTGLPVYDTNSHVLFSNWPHTPVKTPKQ